MLPKIRDNPSATQHDPDMSGQSGQAADANEALVRALYPQLKRIARDLRWRYGTGETMRSTALVNECYLKLRGSDGFVDEGHFLRTAARAMRQILVNHAEARLAAKRGGGQRTEAFEDDLPFVYWESDDRLVALNAALERLASFAPRLAQIVELRFFGGYAEREIAVLLDCNERTVRRDWVKAKSLLLIDMSAASEPA
ncbi:ECF-type sigma factor [Sphingomonas sp. CJ99]